MTKIAYNACYGGFGLSELAGIELARRKGLKLYSRPSESISRSQDYFTDPSFSDESYYSVTHPKISRTDPDLIAVIEELGEKANGYYANLHVRELPAGTKYRIDKYDGYESVVTQDEYEWSVA